MKIRAALALSALLSGVAVSASADLPPPDGQKFVDFAFKVENVKAFPEWALVAYPCSDSNGAPTTEAKVVSDGQPVSVGRRGGQPQLYRMKRADYEANKDGFQSAGDQERGKKLEELFASDKVVKCAGVAPSPSYVLAKTDPRSSIVQTLRVEAIDATGCKIAAVADTNPATPTSGSNPPNAAAPAQKSGCAGCAMPTEPASESGFIVLSLLALGFRFRGNRPGRVPRSR